MNYFIISGAFFISLVISYIFFFLYKSKNYIKSPILFFFIVFLAAWSSQLWITPIGPDLWGISWIPMTAVALIFALVIVAIYALPFATSSKPNGNIITQKNPLEITGLLIWLLLLMLFATIIYGYRKNSLVFIL